MSWWEIARAQGGAISGEQLRRGGLSPDAIFRMSRTGELRRLSRGVYLGGGAPLTFRLRLWAAVLATEGVLGYGTAGQLWGVHDESAPTIHVIVPHARRLAVPDGVTLHRCRLPATDVTARSGLPVSSRTWTVLDLVSSLPRRDASRLADRAIQRRWVTRADFARRLRDHPKRRGNAQLRALMAQLVNGAAADSERLLHRLLRQAGITGWQANHEVWAGGELIGVVDVAFPDMGLAIEVDGMAHHVDVDRFRRDRSRQNALVALGWTVLRFTWADLTERPGYVIAMIRRIAA